MKYRQHSVSIVIPLYNYEQYICYAIDSCLNQDYTYPFEIIVVDDCSTDNSYQKVADTYGDKITLLQCKRNKGYSAAKNLGIENSTGEYITCLDADDMMTPDSVSLRANILQKMQNIILVHAKAYSVYGDGDFDYWQRRLYKIGISQSKKIHAQTVMVRRSLYQDYGLYDESLRSRSDNEMWWRLQNVCNVGNRFVLLEQPVAFYRKHKLSMIEYRKNNPAYNEDVTRILEEQQNRRLSEGVNKINTKFLRT